MKMIQRNQIQGLPKGSLFNHIWLLISTRISMWIENETDKNIKIRLFSSKRKQLSRRVYSGSIFIESIL